MPTALVVDDDADMRDLIEIKLSVSGFDVVTARDGLEGFNAWQETKPDFAVVDVNMPRMSGLELVALIRRTRGLAATPVMILSALSQESDKRAGLEAGANAYLTKPFSPAALVRAIRAMLDDDEPDPAPDTDGAAPRQRAPLSLVRDDD